MKTKYTLSRANAIRIKKNFATKKSLLSFFLWIMLISCAVKGIAQDYNTAYGEDALDLNTSGDYNTAFGWQSLNKNTTGSSNTGHGWHSLYSNQAGAYNTAIGAGSLNYTTSSYNTAIGYYSLYGNKTGANNTAAGYKSLWSNSTGNNNTTNGYQSLASNTTGSYNTANGANALYANTTGTSNTSTGNYSLYSNKDASGNTANGGWSLYHNINGGGNTAIGYESMHDNQSGSGNTATGLQSLYLNTSGFYNTANGASALYSNTTGSFNTGLGYNANVASGNLTNATAIGYNAIATASNQVMLGNAYVTSVRLTSVSGSKYLEFFRQGSSLNQADWRFDHIGGSLYVSSSSDDFTSFCDNARFGTCTDTYKFTVMGNALASGGTWQTSDLKLKKNISEFNSALDIIKQLKPKTYFFKEGEYSKLNLSASKQYGFIAQDLEKVLPELVQTSQLPVRVNAAGERQMEDLKVVNYTELIPILTKAIQEQQQQIEELKQMVEKLSRNQSVTTKSTDAESAKTNIMIANATLKQNRPNPFTNTTSIQYNVPTGTKNAQIIITDNSGKAVKQITLNAGAGVVNIDASVLSTGTYTYTLLVDGKLIESKKMTVAH